MGDRTETKEMTLVTEHLHFVKRGPQLWGFTEHYGAILGTYEAMIAQMPAIGRVIRDRHKGVESYLDGFDKSFVAHPRPHPRFPAIVLFGDTSVARMYVEIVEAMASSGIKGRATPPTEAPYWRARDAYSAAWYVVDGEPIGLILPLIQKSKWQA